MTVDQNAQNQPLLGTVTGQIGMKQDYHLIYFWQESEYVYQ